MSLLGALWERFILKVEDSSFGLNRWTGVAQYSHPGKYLSGYFNEDRGKLGAYCDEVGRDLFAYLRPPEVSARSIAVTRLPPAGRLADEVLSFPSPRPSGVAANDTVRVHRYRSRAAAPEGTVLFHHPAYRAGLAWIEWFTRPLRSRFDVVVMEIPYHLSRAPAGMFSGERLINPNPIHLYEGLRQWMADHHALLEILTAEARGGSPASLPVAQVGYSLGAYLATLYSNFEPRLPIVSICGTNDYATGVFEGILTTSLRSCVEAAGITREEWERMSLPLKLHLHASTFPADRILSISARYDRVEPIPSIERFHRALNPRRRLALPSGHSTTAVLFRGRIMRAALKFIDEMHEEGRDGARGALGTAGS